MERHPLQAAERNLLEAWRSAMWRIGKENHQPPAVRPGPEGTVSFPSSQSSQITMYSQ